MSWAISREAVLAFVNGYEHAPLSPPWDEGKGWEDQAYPEEEIGLRAAFPAMLRDFLDSEEARDATGAMGHTNVTGDELRARLVEAAGGVRSAREEGTHGDR